MQLLSLAYNSLNNEKKNFHMYYTRSQNDTDIYACILSMHKYRICTYICIYMFLSICVYMYKYIDG